MTSLLMASGGRQPPGVEPGPGGLRPPLAKTSHASRVAVSLAIFAVLVAVPNLAYRVALDQGPPLLRDPEYGVRLARLHERMAEHPGRPPVVIVGSSRTGMGIRPGVGEPAGPADPLLFNLSLSGGGPLLQVLTVRRLHADGLTPAAVVLEFWPPMLVGGIYHEQGRIDPPRLRPCDEPSVRQFYWSPDTAWAARYGDTVLPLYGVRQPLMNQVAPHLLSWNQRTDRGWRTADAWGWWPAWDQVSAEKAEEGWPDVEKAYRPRYANYRIDPQHAAAYRAAVAELRGRGVPILIVRMPETERFRTLQTPEGEALADEFLKSITDKHSLEVLDCRQWAETEELPDGFHLTTRGAERVSRRLVGEVRTWWAKQK